MTKEQADKIARQVYNQGKLWNDNYGNVEEHTVVLISAALVDASKVTECAEFESAFEKTFKTYHVMPMDKLFLDFWNTAYLAGQKSKALKLPSELQKQIEELKEIESESTSVVRWYAHPDEVRGPFCRWLTVTDVDPQYEKHVGTKRADAKFAAESMNFVIELIKSLNEGK